MADGTISNDKPETPEERAEREKVERLIAWTKDWPKVIELAHPIPFGKNEVIERLTFREGTLGDLRGFKLDSSPPSVDDLIAIAQNMTGQPPRVIEQLRREDLSSAMEIAAFFYIQSLGTGAK